MVVERSRWWLSGVETTVPASNIKNRIYEIYEFQIFMNEGCIICELRSDYACQDCKNQQCKPISVEKTCISFYLFKCHK